MRNPYLRNGDPASHWIYFDFDDSSGIRIGGRRPHAAALVQRGRLRWSVAAHGSEIRVAGEQSNVERVEAQNLGNYSRQNIVRSLPDFGRAAENTNATAAVEFQLNSRVRHFVPVNGKSRPGQISGAGQTHAAAFREFAEFFSPSGDLYNSANALGKIDGSEPEEICRHG